MTPLQQLIAKMGWMEKELHRLNKAVDELSTARRTRASRKTSDMTEDWIPAPDTEIWTLERYSNEQYAKEIGRFKDYWLATGKRKVNWQAAFRNWMRNSDKFSGKPQSKTRAVSASNRTKRNRIVNQLDAVAKRGAKT